MKARHHLLLLCCLNAASPLRAQVGYTVQFDTMDLPSSPIISDFDGTPLQGTNFWAQLYSADGLTATADQLHAAGIPVNFQTGADPGGPGYVQIYGQTALGQTIPSLAQVVVTSVSNGPASVQIRAWSGPFTSYEAATNGGARVGASRILRMAQSSWRPAAPPPMLTDADGDVNGFNLSFGVPALSINDIIVVEGTSGTVAAMFNVNLSGVVAQTVTAGFGTSDGTALAGSDYVATNGTVSFAPGQTNQTITVAVTAHSPSDLDKNFFVTLTDPVNAPLACAVGTATITDLRVTGISFNTTVSFHTIAGHAYVVEKTDSTGMSDWTPVSGATNVLGTGGTVTVEDQGAGCTTNRFYRARLIQ